MKRFMIFLALFSVMAFGTFALLRSDSSDIQFEGYATYQNGNPAEDNTIVSVYDGNQLLKSAHVIQGQGGYYRITGDDSEFPSKTYRLIADDGGIFGDKNCWHSEGTTTHCDIVMDTAY